jgi:hypothetical protein
MAAELVKAPAASVRMTCNAALLPELVERAGGAARFDTYVMVKNRGKGTLDETLVSGLARYR